MHAIDTAGSVGGTFSEGNPAVGQRATRVGAAWLNDVQANLLRVLTEGEIAPTKGRAADLTDAIKAIVLGVSGTGSGGSNVPTTRVVSTGGLATGGGDLSANRTISVPAASASDVIEGTSDTKAMTPAAFAGSLAGSLAGGSIQIGPLIIKTGTVIGSYSEGAVYTAFAAPFPTTCWTVQATIRNDTNSSTRDFMANLVGHPSAAGFTLRVQRGSNATDAIDGFEWLAIGY